VDKGGGGVQMRSWASAAGSRGPPWIFKHGTNIVDRGLKVLFFANFRSFFRCPPWKIFCLRSWMRTSALFWCKKLLISKFMVCPHGQEAV